MNSKKGTLLLKILGIYFFLAIVFRWVGGENLNYKYLVSEVKQQTGMLEELDSGKILKQNFIVDTETLDTIDILVATYGRTNEGQIQIKILDSEGEIVASHQEDVNLLIDNELYKWIISPGIENTKGKEFQLQITTNCD